VSLHAAPGPSPSGADLIALRAMVGYDLRGMAYRCGPGLAGSCNRLVEAGLAERPMTGGFRPTDAGRKRLALLDASAPGRRG